MSEDRYLVTARKYRPRRFDDLVAQQHVSDTLRNALVQDRLAHAYLFSGPRGVGKTTAARILGQAINCTTALDDRDRGEPCGTCEACASFQEGRNLNIIEIDAASNNSVDDVRSLREKVRIPPQGGKKKVYIIDEVHMLSNQAFNALLKTLEEPPSHVLFIFATTEPNKVLPTILSRCQRFDFRRIAIPEIMDRLRYVCEEEDVDYDEESLMLIAKRGNGALRDALSVFDQAVALCGTELRYDELAEALGVVEVDLYFRVTERVRENDTSGMIELVEEIVRSGHDLQEFLQGLAEHLRNLMVARSTGSTELIQATEANRERYGETASAFEEADLLRLLMIASDAASEAKSSPQPRLKVELALLKMAHLNRTADLTRLIEQLEGEGDRPAGPTSNADSGDAPTEPASGGDGRNERGSDSTVEKTTKETTTAERSSAEEEPSNRGAPTQDAPEPGDDPEPRDESEQRSPTSSQPGEAILGTPELKKDDPGSATAAPQPNGAEAESAARDQAQAGGAHTEGAASKPAHAEESAADPETAGNERGKPEPTPQETTGAEPTMEKVESTWNEFLRRVKKERVTVGTCLQHTRPGTLTDERLTIRVPDNFHRQTLREASRELHRTLKEVSGLAVPPLAFTVDADLDEENEEELDTGEDPFEHVKKLRDEDPVVRALFEDFGGDLVY